MVKPMNGELKNAKLADQKIMRGTGGGDSSGCRR